MKNERTITICGKDVKLRYCAATENGFEKLAGKSMAEWNVASIDDLMKLSMSAIVAAYERNNEEVPIDGKDILYDASPSEITELFKVVIEIRAEWYGVPLVLDKAIKEEQGEEAEQPKNE